LMPAKCGSSPRAISSSHFVVGSPASAHSRGNRRA